MKENNIKIQNKKNPGIIGAIAICIAAMLWGLDGTLLTPKLFNLEISFVVFMLHLIPFIIMNTFLFREYRHLAKMTKKDFLLFFLVAIFGGVLGTLSIVKALFLVNFQHLSVVLLLQKLQPIFAITLAYILLKEKIKKGFLVWAGLAITASYFMTFGFNIPNFATGENTIPAVLYSIIAASSFGAATVLGKKVVSSYNFKTAGFYRFGITTIIMGIYVAIFGKFTFSQITTQNWIVFLIIAILIGILSVFLFYYGLTRVKASKSTIYELSFPISVIVFDYIFNNNILSAVQLLAAGVMIFAIVKISMLKK